MKNTDNKTHDKIERSIADIDWVSYQKRQFTPSPAAWEDQVLYFLMLDRFSDGKEKSYLDNSGSPVLTGTTPQFQFDRDAYKADRKQWAAQGNRWLGGTLKGLASKIGYLKRLGVSAIWISPVFKQMPKDEYSYHGYAIQNFLDIDPRFGCRQDLQDLVDTAHAQGIYVILDIIFNHSGDVFAYDADRYVTDDGHGGHYMDPRWDNRSYRVKGYRNADGKAEVPFARIDLAVHPEAWPDQAIWPEELQDTDNFTCKGRISNWDYDPEFREGDFITLKDIDHGRHDYNAEGKRIIDNFYPSKALTTFCDIYKFWIAFADIDGYRIDTVKHMEPGATRYFTAVVQEYAQSLGKENFYLIGEITGGREFAFNLMETTGLNAALGIDEIPDKLEYLAKGYRDPQSYFSLFRNSVLVGKGSHTWYGKHIVTLFDDHDQVRKGENKARFCGDTINHGYAHLSAVVALNLTTMGIPCLYYGTEQAFNGAGDNDRYLRECMFGGKFGSLQSTDRHFFNEAHEIYRLIADINQIRKERLALRRGRQYLRQISESGEAGTFGLPHMIGDRILSVVPWSRIFDNHEIVLAVNTDIDKPRTAWVTIDNALHGDKSQFLECIYSTDRVQIGSAIKIEVRNGKAVHLTVPPGGFVIYE
ncbi:alpha-amylase family glycosyl hydrolase [Nitrosomonas sp. Nm132]|uniref:alpha-amylase family glycosyl hydrolase n=1 Tax=Nitrosomonas sp. Nm132 TaxID=1881053 RepID=UPI00088A0390|nr:alpha-amylase family glycosyl hydrolase [Nitrosomonas sp. Nm132]SDH56987.1 Glycosidase [Nitrosomonas sp. Nm132]